MQNITLAFKLADKTRVQADFTSVDDAIECIKNRSHCTIGESVSIRLDGKSIAFINGPSWFSCQQFADDCEYFADVILSPDTMNFLYDAKHPLMPLVRAVNEWAGVNVPQRRHSLTDGTNISYAGAELKVLYGCTTYLSFPLGLSYDGGKTAVYCKTMDEVARELRELDIVLMP